MGHDGMAQMPHIAVDISAQGWRFLILGEGQGGGWVGAGNLWMGTSGLTHKYWHYQYGTRMAGGMYGDNCGIFAGKARPAPHLIQPCPEWCVHTSLLIQPAGEEEVHRAVHSLRFTAHLARVLVVHMKPLSPGATFTEKSLL